MAIKATGVTFFIITFVFCSAAIAGPTVEISTDKTAYREGETIVVSIRGENYDEAMVVDVYVAMLGSDGAISILSDGGWCEPGGAWLAGLSVPSPFWMDPAPFQWIDLPSEKPPIGQWGTYAFAAFAIESGSLDYWSPLSLAPFTCKGSSAEIVMVGIPAGSFLMGSPEDEANRRDDEGPQRTVSVSAMLA